MTTPISLTGEVLCVKSNPFHNGIHAYQSLRVGDTAVIPFELKDLKDNLCSVQRNHAETDQRYLQILPYVVMRREDGRILTYRRGKSGTEKKLHDRYSIGLGGHIDEGIDYDRDRLDTMTLRATLEKNAYREVLEETGFSLLKRSLVPRACLVTQDRNDPVEVGWFHIAVLFCITVPEGFTPNTQETCMKEFEWLTPLELQQRNLEPWSMAALALITL